METSHSRMKLTYRFCRTVQQLACHTVIRPCCDADTPRDTDTLCDTDMQTDTDTCCDTDTQTDTDTCCDTDMRCHTDTGYETNTPDRHRHVLCR